MKKKILRKALSALTSATVAVSALVFPAEAYYIDEENPNNYDNFAQALQLALCFYDANKCGDEVGEDGYYSWRGDCHVKDAEIPLVKMVQVVWKAMLYRIAARVMVAQVPLRVFMLVLI